MSKETIKDTAAAEPQAPALLTLLETVDNGEPLAEANEVLREIITESYQRGGKGELILKVKLETTIARGTPKTEVRIEVQGKAPKLPAGTSTFFATAGGELRRDDPAQMELAEGMGKTIRITSRRGKAAAAPAEKEAGQA